MGEERGETELKHLKNAGGEVNGIEANEMLLNTYVSLKKTGKNADGQRLTDCILLLSTSLK